MAKPFEVVCEIEPATSPDLRHVRHQIGVLAPVASGFLIPDNHIGRATVSSIAVAHEVMLMGGRAIACLNARDRNTLGFRRDLLTAAAYGVREFLFVYGDRPEHGRRSDDLTVRSMIDQARLFAAEHYPGDEGIRIGVSSRLGAVPGWKQEADFLFAQVSFSSEELFRWRETVEFSGPVYAGVMVVASAAMARKLTADIAQLAVPEWLTTRLASDPRSGVDYACEMIAQIKASAAFDGVHLVPVRRYREVALLLEGTPPGPTAPQPGPGI
ncbi:MAG TPA: methylenetetrahydrofolate reductase [Acidimicrobiales bacterium]|nr:methylenetetrahydrofolate reductase [Acidimicrobiales bacterium]